MGNDLRGKILFYLSIWAGLFVLLCIISLVKNGDVLVAAVSSAFASMIGSVVVIGLMLYGIFLLLRSIFR